MSELEDQLNLESSDLGSSNTDPSTGGESDKDVDLSDYISKTEYDQLAEKLGTQGQELGELRNFINTITPMLQELEENPQIADAILAGKLDGELATAIMEGKVSISDAEKVAQAHDDIKKEMGKEQYTTASKKDINEAVEKRLQSIDEKVETFTRDVTEKLSKSEEKKQFIDKTNLFIQEATDFEEYAEAISTWLEEHPNIYDIEVAYEAVKGRSLTEESKLNAEKKIAEEKKNLASNMYSGQGHSEIIKEDSLIDTLIGPISSPNLN